MGTIYFLVFASLVAAQDLAQFPEDNIIDDSYANPKMFNPYAVLYKYDQPLVYVPDEYKLYPIPDQATILSRSRREARRRYPSGSGGRRRCPYGTSISGEGSAAGGIYQNEGPLGGSTTIIGGGGGGNVGYESNKPFSGSSSGGAKVGAGGVVVHHEGPVKDYTYVGGGGGGLYYNKRRYGRDIETKENGHRIKRGTRYATQRVSSRRYYNQNYRPCQRRGGGNLDRFGRPVGNVNFEAVGGGGKIDYEVETPFKETSFSASGQGGRVEYEKERPFGGSSLSAGRVGGRFSYSSSSQGGRRRWGRG